MEKLKSFEELFQREANHRIKLGDKFLGIFPKKALEELEELLGTDLGIRKERKMRPFIGFYRDAKKRYCLVFLSTKNYSGFFVDLKFCSRKTKGKCGVLEPVSFVLKDRTRKKALAYSIPESRFEELYFELCGFCENMEWLEELEEV